MFNEGKKTRQAIEKIGGVSRARTDDLIVANDGVCRHYLIVLLALGSRVRSITVQFQIQALPGSPQLHKTSSRNPNQRERQRALTYLTIAFDNSRVCLGPCEPLQAKWEPHTVNIHNLEQQLSRNAEAIFWTADSRSSTTRPKR